MVSLSHCTYLFTARVKIRYRKCTEIDSFAGKTTLQRECAVRVFRKSEAIPNSTSDMDLDIAWIISKLRSLVCFGEFGSLNSFFFFFIRARAKLSKAWEIKQWYWQIFTHANPCDISHHSRGNPLLYANTWVVIWFKILFFNSLAASKVALSYFHIISSTHNSLQLNRRSKYGHVLFFFLIYLISPQNSPGTQYTYFILIRGYHIFESCLRLNLMTIHGSSFYIPFKW